MQERIHLTDLKEGTAATINCKLEDKEAEFGCTVAKICDTFICLDVPKVDGKALTFDGVRTSISGIAEDGVLYKFSDCAIVLFKGVYVAKCEKAGSKVNRRGSFRVGVSLMASMLRGGADPSNVYVRDISATGYSITTDKDLEIGEEITVKFEETTPIYVWADGRA